MVFLVQSCHDRLSIEVSRLFHHGPWGRAPVMVESDGPSGEAPSGGGRHHTLTRGGPSSRVVAASAPRPLGSSTMGASPNGGECHEQRCLERWWSAATPLPSVGTSEAECKVSSGPKSEGNSPGGRR
jgi:hypothetical protein